MKKTKRLKGTWNLLYPRKIIILLRRQARAPHRIDPFAKTGHWVIFYTIFAEVILCIKRKNFIEFTTSRNFSYAYTVYQKNNKSKITTCFSIIANLEFILCKNRFSRRCGRAWRKKYVVYILFSCISILPILVFHCRNYIRTFDLSQMNFGKVPRFPFCPLILENSSIFSKRLDISPHHKYS